MAKTIQVRVDDDLKDNADSLFASLGLDTSTAVRMFLVAAMEAGGIPFNVMRGNNRDAAISELLARQKAGARFYTDDETRQMLRSIITESGV
ncbi:MAG: type II toxin-antitoxin system RelB/DinJ family antitoxin [Oscillospiraceae bacterium]|nr:type II toxin-antitoxin system RelB/DinJ family antitoxin [Oscillospiraceae bacterium]